jgi:Transposase IS66 family
MQAMVASVLVSKYAWHLPLYRQAQMLAAQGLDWAVARDDRPWGGADPPFTSDFGCSAAIACATMSAPASAHISLRAS